MSREPPREVAPDEPPPILGSWRNLYLFVVGELGLLVLLFYALTRWAS
jgi:hypothetical protein